MSMNEPGLDLHEWETRWAELEEALVDAAVGNLRAIRDAMRPGAV